MKTAKQQQRSGGEPAATERLGNVTFITRFLGRKRQAAAEAAEIARAVIDDDLTEAGDGVELLARGPELLRDGPLFAAWYIRYQLERELARSKRHRRALSVMVLTPVPSLGLVPSAETLNSAAEVARDVLRMTDLIGWLPPNRILVILPETDRDGAAAAVYRLSTKMHTRTLTTGQVRWVVTANFEGHNCATVDELLAAATEEVARTTAV
jgi:hypothetical protein